MPKLYEGCWGVTRGRDASEGTVIEREVIGPISRNGINRFTAPNGKYLFRPDGNCGINGTQEWPMDILHVFPTREAARAYLSRPSWWRRFLSLIKRWW